MKTRILLWLLLLLSSSAWAQLNIKESFEAIGSDYGYTSSFSNTTSNSTYFTRTTNPKTGFGNPVVSPTGVDGSWFWAAEGVRDFGRTIPAATVTLNGIPNAGNYNNIKVRLLVTDPRAGNGGTATNDDHMRIQYAYSVTNAVPASNQFTTVGEFTNDGTTNPGRWYQYINGVRQTSNVVTANFTPFDFSIGSGSGFLFIRVEVDDNQSGREIGFDNIQVTGDAPTTSRPELTTTDTGDRAYAEGGAALPVFTNLTANNTTANTLDGAKVIFTNGTRVAAQDELTYTIPAGSGIQLDGPNSVDGALVFKNTSSEDNYRDLLLSVKYRNTSATGARGGTRSLEFTVSNGASTSLALSRNIVVTAKLNDAVGLAVPFTEDFEDDGEGSTYGSNTGTSGTQGFLRLTGPPGATFGSSTVFGLIQGSGYFYGRGTKEFLNASSNGLPTAGNNIATPQGGILMLAPINTTGYTDLHFKLKAAAAGSTIAADDFLRFSYNLNNGGGWQTLSGSFTGSAGALRQNGNGLALTSNMQDVDITLPAAVAGTNVSFRMEVGVNGGEEVAFDYIQVTGTPVPTTVSSIVRANANPTNAATVQYTVTFAGSVTGLTTSNFNLTTTGALGATPSVSSVSGSGTTYTVTVNTGSGSGTLRLNLNNASGLTPSVSNVPYTSGEVYTIDKDGPAVTSVNVPANGTYRTGQTLSFVANFSENVTVTGTLQLALTIGSTTRQAAYASGSGTAALTFSYTIQSGDQDTDGIALGALALNGGTLRDALGNNATLTLNGAPSTAGILVDGVAPTVSSSNRQNPAGSSTSGTSVIYRVTFSEAVTGVTTTSFTLVTTTGSTTGTISAVASVSGSNGTQYDVTVNSINGNGTIRLDVKSSGSGITDVAGNALSGGFSTGQTYDINQAVAVTSVTGLTPSPAATATVSYTVSFSGSVTGLTTSNFNLTTSGLTGASVSSVSGSGSSYTVVVNTGSGDGTLRLNVNNSSGVTPTLSNVPYTSGTTYTITKSFAAAPTLRIQGASSASGLSDVTAFVDVVQVLSGGAAFANGLQNTSFESNNAGTNSFLYQQQGVVATPWSFTAQAGISRNNSGFGSTAADGTSVALLQSAASLNGSISQNLAVPTGTSYQISFQTTQRTNNGASDQVVNVFVNDVFVGSIQPGNTYQTFTSATFSVTAPALTATISSTAGASGSGTSTAPIPFAVSFSQSVGTTFTASDVTVAGGALTGGSFSGSGAGPYTFSVTPSGNGTVSVSLAAGVAFDANNTGNTATSTYSLNYTQPVTAAPVVTTPTNGSFVNTSTPTYTGTAAVGATVTVYVDGSALSGTVTADGSGNWSKTQPVALSQGSHTVYATAQLSGQTVSANSNTNTFTVDTTPPPAPVVITPANGSVTNNNTPTYTGTAEANSTVTVIVDGSALSGTVTANASGNWSKTQPVALSQGSHQVRATATDAAGNTSVNSNTNTFIIDTTPPPAPVVVTPANGSAVATTIPTYTGTAEANATVTVIVDGSALSGTVIANASGNWSKTQPVALSQGSHTVRATATDAAGNTSPSSATNTFTVDTTPPAAPVVVTPANGSTTTNTTPTYTGTAEPNSTVTVIVDGSALSGTVTANVSGNWTKTQPVALSFGSHTVRATATDLAGNTSPSSNTNTFTVLNPATYTSSTADQPNTGRVAAGSPNQEILRVAVVVGGGPDNPLSAESFSFTTNGSTNPADIAAARVYYTGTSGTFATTTPFGSAVNSPSGSFSITGSQQLSTGTNYFFLVYDVAGNATNGNVLDATVPSLTISGTAYTPSVASPAGNRRIVNTSRVAGTALRFVGENTAGYVNFSADVTNPAPNLSLTGQYTQSVWIKPVISTGSSDYYVLGNGTGASAAPYIYVSGNGRVGAGYGSAAQQAETNPNYLSANTWYHVVATYDGSVLRLYVNGEVAATDNTTATVPSTRVNFIGNVAAATSGNFPGDIDEVSQWNVALTQTQIRLMRHLTLRGTEPNLVSYLQFNDSGSTTTDLISGTVGTLTGASRVTSTAPVGFGTSNLQTVTASTTYNFTGTNVSIAFSGVSGSSETVVFRLDGQPLGTQPSFTGLRSVFTPAYWIIDKYPTGTFTTANVTYTLSPVDISLDDQNTPSNLKLFKRGSNADGTFDAPISATSANAAAGTVTFPVTSFSQTVIGSIGTSPLPVTLLSFTAERIGDDGLLRWTTAQEKNNAYFEVESSVNGREFRSIGRQTGNGNSTTRHDYQLKDAQLLRYGASTVYYRLRQVDFDGTATLSDVVALTVTGKAEATAEVFPNPAADQLTLRLLGADAAQAQAQLYDAQGRLVQKLSPASRLGADLLFPVQHLPNGVYTLRVLLPGRVLHRSVVIRH